MFKSEILPLECEYLNHIKSFDNMILNFMTDYKVWTHYHGPDNFDDTKHYDSDIVFNEQLFYEDKYMFDIFKLELTNLVKKYNMIKVEI